MNADDDPPSRAAPSSSRTNSAEGGQSALDWPDDETFVNAPAPDAVARRNAMSARMLLSESTLDLSLALLAGSAGLDRPIGHTRIQKSGLALAGHYHGIVATRVQILGQTEQSYLAGLSPDARQKALFGFFGLGLSCVVVTGEAAQASPEISACADVTGAPLIGSGERSSVTISALHALLDERLAPRKRLHGVLIDVFGVGLLLMGPSGVGKSECALDLVMRGHRLVADDVVECDYRPPGMVFGCPAKLLRHHLEVRGLGILNIKDLFGVTAIRERKRIDVVVRLVEEASAEVELDRMGLDDRFHTILGVSIPELVIPVRPGRDMASILEVAARNELLKNAGHHAARELFGAIERKMSGQVRPGAPARRDLAAGRSAESDRVGPDRAGQPRDSVADRAGQPRDSVADRAGQPRGSEPRGHVSPRSQESQFGMRPIRLPRADESAAPPPVTGGPPRGRR